MPLRLTLGLTSAAPAQTTTIEELDEAIAEVRKVIADIEAS